MSTYVGFGPWECRISLEEARVRHDINKSPLSPIVNKACAVEEKDLHCYLCKTPVLGAQLTISKKTNTPVYFPIGENGVKMWSFQARLNFGKDGKVICCSDCIPAHNRNIHGDKPLRVLSPNRFDDCEKIDLEKSWGDIADGTIVISNNTNGSKLFTNNFYLTGCVCLECGEEAKHLINTTNHGWKAFMVDMRNHITIDHVVPRAAGGTDDIENLQSLCRTCNGKKGDKFVIPDGIETETVYLSRSLKNHIFNHNKEHREALNDVINCARKYLKEHEVHGYVEKLNTIAHHKVKASGMKTQTRILPSEIFKCLEMIR